jgi:CRP/FNR family cyclic AMP-dependent transcriptional regulator
MEKIKSLQQTQLFKHLEAADLQNIAQIIKKVTFEKGQQVITQGDAGDTLFVIESGAVRVLRKGGEGKEEVARLNAGQHFGEMSLIDDERRSATVEAIEHSELIKIERGDLESLLAKDVSFAKRFYHSLAKYLSLRLRETSKNLTHMMDSVKELRKLNYYPESW